jgi:hypothetical protein
VLGVEETGGGGEQCGFPSLSRPRGIGPVNLVRSAVNLVSCDSYMPHDRDPLPMYQVKMPSIKPLSEGGDRDLVFNQLLLLRSTQQQLVQGVKTQRRCSHHG